MKRQLIITVIAKDKPGIVETLAKVVSARDGNWEESRMVSLAGKFSGLLLVSVGSEQLDALQADLAALNQQGIKTLVDVAEEAPVTEAMRLVSISLVGADRPGIVREVAKALSSRNINVEELNTDYSSMPWSGEPMFQVHAALQVPADSDLDELQDTFDQIADELAVDIELEQPDVALTH
ncbi:glycine cleavage system protein R [Simiduia agarivorans]|uniref:Glycine cleavage system transcriptional repressor n=1 Tax=Simiduia agarivorans (strain DSM 21679 / JCM 13881 / BCRC 17597 / SA1) TaxID=1117647 RepID=K4KGD8_SIMAS|nr:ACT domain-containing protein [Simiduia agarivorans]AFU98046.1 ACT domain-containing protein [Simiduia agarivorans SA1 = DSM 21679]